jgi:DNA-binding XRE family transcriptional regulator
MFTSMLVPISPRADQKLAAALRRLREERGAIQEDVAHDADITTRTLQKIEGGQSSPEWATVRRIAKALDISLTELAEAVEAD